MSPAGLQELAARTEHLIHADEASELVDFLYGLSTDDWMDEHFAAVEALIDRTIALLTAVPRPENQPLIDRLRIAREGVEQGMAPDPAKRPSDDQMRAYVSANL